MAAGYGSRKEREIRSSNRRIRSRKKAGWQGCRLPCVTRARSAERRASLGGGIGLSGGAIFAPGGRRIRADTRRVGSSSDCTEKDRGGHQGIGGLFAEPTGRCECPSGTCRRARGAWQE